MADYHAVLQRTLSGFTDPKPQLRMKLYERARTTIERQLTNREPPVVGDALSSELHKLEQAIASVEQSYDPSYPDPVVTPSEPIVAPAEESTPLPEPESPQPQSISNLVVDTPPMPLPESVQLPETQYAPQEEPMVAAVEQVATTIDPVPVEELPPTGIQEQLVQPEVPVFEPYSDTVSEVNPQPTLAENVHAPADNQAVDMWAKEFMDGQAQASEVAATQPIAPEPAPVSDPAPVVTQVIPSTVESVPQPQPVLAPSPAPEAIAPQVAASSGFGTEQMEQLTIPPAPTGFGENVSRRPKSRGFLKWLILLLLACIVALAGYYGWQNKDVVLQTTGLSSLFEDPNDPTRPKPVKTISIKPEPETEEPTTQAPEAIPKNEARLGENGEEILPNPSQSGGTEQPQVSILPASQPKIPAAPANGLPAVSQNAILYEEGSTASENSVDAGRVVWSVVQESPGNDEPKEPAIRGRIEIPSRNVILIMTIKRNTDKALPASHLIELVFAVPDDFSGGSIGQVSRFVLKESEQGRGEGLVGVPARIADGIFLIALNNLEEAQNKNEALLKSRDWIDIPMQYRTGRRALVTVEKGIPGEKVFKEVFEAWSKL